MRGKKRWLIFMVLLLSLITAIRGTGERENSEEKTGFAKKMVQELSKSLGAAVYGNYMPCISFVRHQGNETPWILKEQINSLLPFYGYMEEELQAENGSISPSVREIFLEEAREETSYAVNEENREEEVPTELDTTLAELLRTENEAAMQMRQTAAVFVPHTQQRQIEMEVLKDYETLISEFYTVDANTMVGSDQLNAVKLAAKDMTVSRESAKPQILIFHTHSQETFSDSVPGDTGTSIVGVGERLADILEQDYGYGVLHHTAEYDVEVRDDAYAKALPGVEQVLADNPSIQVVIDLHRDEMPEETRLVMDLDGRPTARFMFFNGLSRTKKTGNISYLYNENLEGNLAFSFQMQKKACEYYPGLTRKIYLKGYRYNMHLKSKYLLVELGAQNNTVEEAMNACDPLAHILDMVLSGQ